MADKPITVSGLIAEVDEAIKAKDALTEKVAGLREILRHFDKAGQLSPEQSTWVAQAFPTKERKSKAERQSELEAQLAKLQAGADDGEGE